MCYNHFVRKMVAVIPAYEPDARLPQLIRRLETVFNRFVVVNDGSRSARSVFDALRADSRVTVLVHDKNRGKGAALKTAFAETHRRFPDATGIITADADGQHLPDDIIRVARALLEDSGRPVVGVRTFGHDIPFRSKLGNLWTAAEFRLLTGRAIQDTQTGLRGIPFALIPRLLDIPGDRYDFEIRMLVWLALRSEGVRQVPIRTIYEPGNGTSHFRPLTDTISTQRALIAEAVIGRFGGRSRA